MKYRGLELVLIDLKKDTNFILNILMYKV